MKIKNITIENFVGARNIDLLLNNPITIIAGPNGAGKSSIRDAIALALTADLGRVSIKKDSAQMITHGSDRADIKIDVDDYSVSVSISQSGKITDSLKGVDVPPALPYVLEGQRFARMSASDRRSFLFGLMSLSANPNAIKYRMIKRGISPESADKIAQFLRAGFESAAEEAQKKAREYKAQWKTVTGGETYGSQKAASWRAEEPTRDINQLVNERAKLQSIDDERTTLNQQLGALTQRIAAAAADTARKAELQESADKRSRIEAKLEIDLAELKKWSKKLAAAREDAGVAPRDRKSELSQYAAEQRCVHPATLLTHTQH